MRKASERESEAWVGTKEARRRSRSDDSREEGDGEVVKRVRRVRRAVSLEETLVVEEAGVRMAEAEGGRDGGVLRCSEGSTRQFGL